MPREHPILEPAANPSLRPRERGTRAPAPCSRSVEGRGPRGLDAAPGRIPGRASEGADVLKGQVSHWCDGHAQGPRAVPLLPRALPSHDHPSSSPRKLPPPAPPASGLPRSTPSVPVPSSGRGLALTVQHAPGILHSWGRRQAATPAPRRGGCAPRTGYLRLLRAVCATDGPQHTHPARPFPEALTQHGRCRVGRRKS